MLRHVLARHVVQKQHRVRALNFFPRTGNAYFFNLIDVWCISVTQTGGIHHMQGHTIYLDQLGNFVARGAGDCRDDGQVSAGQRIEQGAFPGVRLPGDHHLDAFAQDGALHCALHYPGHAALQALQLTAGVGLLQKVDIFFRKIKRRLDQHAQMNQLGQQVSDFFRKLTAE